MTERQELHHVAESLPSLPQLRTEERTCPIHGRYTAKLYFVNGKCMNQGLCPKCFRLAKEAEQREAEAKAQREEDEREQRRIEEAIGRACIPVDFREKSFDTFVADTTELKQALDLSRRFVRGWEKAREGGYGLIFYGNPGTGKSHLAIAIMRELLPRITALYTRTADLVAYIRAQWRTDAEISSYAAVRRFIDLDLLVLDELGVQAGSVNEQNLLFEVIDARLSENRPTIFLSNLSPADLSSVIGLRLADRIKGKCVPQRFTGQSRRKPLTADVFGEAA